LAKLGKIKLKQVEQLSTSGSPFLVRKHKEILNLMMRSLQLDNYWLAWAQFFKGAFIGAFTAWFVMR